MPEELILYIDIRKIPRSQTSSCVSNFGWSAMWYTTTKSL
jgi:hypothetical protein